MKRLTLYYLFFLFVFIVVLYGFAVPQLVSAADTTSVLIGVGLIAIGGLMLSDFIRVIANKAIPAVKKWMEKQ